MSEAKARVARIDAALELLDEEEDDVGALALATRVCEEIAADAAAHVRDLSLLRPGPAGLGAWMLLLARVQLASASLFRRGDALGVRLQRSSVAILAAPMKPLRTSEGKRE